MVAEETPMSKVYSITHQNLTDLFNIGLTPIPLRWDSAAKIASSHVIAHSEVTPENYNADTYKARVKSLEGVNGIAIKLFAPFGCLDFDLKNTDDKIIFDQWLKHIDSQDDEILGKICIERTRNGGYHAYIKYSRLTNKISLAREINGEEVIALYTGGTLSYCDPTPGYEMYHNEWQDLDDLTEDQFDILISSASSFNKYVSQGSNEENKSIVAEYPEDYKSVCDQFDAGIPYETFDILLNELGLYQIKDYKYTKKDHFIAYLRKGSKAKYSAKVYPKSKKLLIFSGSITGFPHWADRKDKDDHTWVITPSKLIYYKNDRDWSTTMDEIKLIAESIGLEFKEEEQVIEIPATATKLSEQEHAERLKFPVDIFPDEIKDFILCHPFQKEYMAGAFIAVMSTLIGNSCTLTPMDGWNIKPIVYMVIVAPPGASKTPATNAAFAFIEDVDKRNYAVYKSEMEVYKHQLAEYKNQKKGEGIPEPKKPVLKQLLLKDVTLEKMLNVLSVNPMGCCDLADEFSGRLKKMNRYGENDEAQQRLSMWSGQSVTVQRIGREDDRVDDIFCSMFGGIQPGVMSVMSTKENSENGFFHRYLFIYPEIEPKSGFQRLTIPPELKQAQWALCSRVYSKRRGNYSYTLSDDASDVYKQWFDDKTAKYNASTSDDVKGIISKYQEYCLRLALIIQIMHEKSNEQLEISSDNMNRAIKLTEYFFANIWKAMKVLAPQSPIDKLSENNRKFYRALPENFNNAAAISVASTFGISSGNCRVILNRWIKKNEDPLLTYKGDQGGRVYFKIYE